MQTYTRIGATSARYQTSRNNRSVTLSRWRSADVRCTLRGWRRKRRAQSMSSWHWRRLCTGRKTWHIPGL